MFFDFSFKSSILLIFFFNGVVFSSLLLIKGLQTQHRANLWLSLFIFLGSLYIAPFMLGYAGWYAKNPYRDFLFYFPFQQLFLLPPVLYFYTRTLLDQSFRFAKKDLINFLPAFIYLLYSLLVFLIDKVVLNDYYFYSDQKDKDFAVWYQVSGFLWMCFYLVLSLKVYRRYKAITYNIVSFAETILFTWVKKFLIAFSVLLLLRIMFFIANPEWAQFGSKFWYYLCFSILCYYIAISGYTNYVQSIIPFINSITIDADVKISKDDFVTSIDEQDRLVFEELKIKIEQIMTSDKIYMQQDLTLADLSKKLDITSKKTSQVINYCFKMNFNDFVNHYRTEAVIQILKTDKPSLFTLLAIALECGFNSKSTFNRAFKKHTSLSPKLYLEKYKIETSAKS